MKYGPLKEHPKVNKFICTSSQTTKNYLKQQMTHIPQFRFNLPLIAFAKTGSDLSSNWTTQVFVQFEHFYQTGKKWVLSSLSSMFKLAKNGFSQNGEVGKLTV